MQRNRKNYMRISLLYVALLLGAGSASAAQLRIIRTGTGSGDVIGEEIVCGDICRAEYPEKTVAHLKAEAYPDSRFVGWFVNGAPYEGALVIEQDTVVQARFDANTPPDDLTVFWYNGDTKLKTTMVLDEIVFFFKHEYEEQIPYEAQEKFSAYMSPILQKIHPHAEILESDVGWMAVKCPEPLSKEQIFALSSLLQEFDFLESFEPVFYENPKDRGSRMLLRGELFSVQYSENFSEERIRTIENEYDLERVKSHTLENTFIYRAGKNVLEMIDIARRLYESGMVELSIPAWTEGLSSKNMLFSALPLDEKYQDGSQWNLETIGLPVAWDITKGRSNQDRPSLIAIVDTGVAITHQDLRPNLYNEDGVRSHDFEDDDDDPSPSRLGGLCAYLAEDKIKMAKHGTNVAGIAIAEGFASEKGICGVAPSAKFIAYRILNRWLDPIFQSAVFGEHYRKIDIFNGSLGGPMNKMNEQPKLDPMVRQVFQRGVIKGRDGKGNIFVFAAGNGSRYSSPLYIGRNSNNNNGFANSRYTIAVSASNSEGKLSSYSDYGAHILINVPSGPNSPKSGLPESTLLKGVTTTDATCFNLTDAYTDDFTGTSAAAPVVSGVAALMLAANPALTWRDVQQILIETADKNPGVTWTPNASGNPQYSHDDHLGFGRVNAGKAVKLATTWPPLPQPEIIRQTNANGNAITIPTNLKIEFVEVTFTSPRGHANWGNLEITLYSPQDKSSSVLAEPLARAKAGRYESWTFGSVRHFGEPSAGAWRLEVKDHGQLLTDFVWTLTIHGTPFPPGLPFHGVYRLKNEDMTWRPDVLPTKDGGYLAVDSPYASGSVLVMKLDAAGGVAWAKTLQGDLSGMLAPHLERTGFYQMNAAVTTYLQQAGLSPVAAALQGALGRKSYASEAVFTSHVRRVLQDFGSKAQAALPGILHHALTETGFIIAAGSGAFKDGGMWVINLDTAGNVRWENAYLLDNGDTPRRHEVSMIRRTNDGSYLLAGYIYGINDPYAIQGWLMKLDQDGIPEWNALSTQEMSISAVEELDDGSYVVTGQAGYALAVGQFSADGLPVAGTLRRYPVGGTSWGTRLARADDGGFFLLGGTMGGGMWGFREWDVLLLKFDETLQPIWQRQYGVPDFDEAYALLPTNDGGALVGGGVCVNRNFGSMCAGTQSAWWLKLKDDGEVAGQRTLADGAYSTIRTLAQTRDGGYVGIGEHYHARTGHSIFVVKTAGIETLLTDPARSCFEAGTPPAMQARPIEVAGELLEMPFQPNTVTHTDSLLVLSRKHLILRHPLISRLISACCRNLCPANDIPCEDGNPRKECRYRPPC